MGRRRDVKGTYGRVSMKCGLPTTSDEHEYAEYFLPIVGNSTLADKGSEVKAPSALS
jgi:hypothetical protein